MGLAVPAIATVSCCTGISSEFRWRFIEGCFTGGCAEIECFSVVIGFQFCFLLIYHHAANWIFSHTFFHLTLTVYCFALLDLNLANISSDIFKTRNSGNYRTNQSRPQKPQQQKPQQKAVWKLNRTSQA